VIARLVAVALLIGGVAAGCQLMPIFEVPPSPRCAPDEVREVACGLCNAGVGRQVCNDLGEWEGPPECEENPYDGDGDGFANVDCFVRDLSCCGEEADCIDDCDTCFPGAEEVPGNAEDEDCDGAANDQDGDGFDAMEDGGRDCDDARADRHPGREPLCGVALDHDCDGVVDELQGCGACRPAGLGLHYDVGPFLARGLFVTGEVALVATDAGLLVMDVSDPARPRAGDLVETGRARSVFRQGDRAYVVTMPPDDADEEPLVVAVDVSSPDEPVAVGAAVEVPGARSIFVSLEHAYVVGSGALDVFRLGDPLMPLQPLSSFRDGAGSAIFVRGSTAVLGAPERCLALLDVTDPEEVLVTTGGELYATCDGDSVFLHGDHVIVASLAVTPGLHVIAAPPGERLERVGEPLRTGISRSVFVAAGHAYVAGEDGLYVVDVSRPETPSLRFHRSTALPRAIFVSGRWVFVGTESGLTTVEIDCE